MSIQVKELKPFMPCFEQVFLWKTVACIALEQLPIS
jgi:hypothetical protein